MQHKRQVIVVGSGLAGLSTSIYLLDKGMKPLILESLPFPGGRTASWVSEGMQIVTGLHRFLGFFNHLPELLHKAGLKLNEVVIWEDEIEIRMPDGPRATFGLSPIHKPLKSLWRLLHIEIILNN